MKTSEIYRNAIERLLATYSPILQDGAAMEDIDFETLVQLAKNYDSAVFSEKFNKADDANA